jgi:hypothetical protein
MGSEMIYTDVEEIFVRMMAASYAVLFGGWESV